MIDNYLLYFLYSIIILSILIIILLSSNLEDDNSPIIPIVSTIGLGGLLAVSQKYFCNNYNYDKKTNNYKLGGFNNEKNTQIIEQKKSELKKEQEKILIQNNDIFKILKESQVSLTLNKQVNINDLYNSNDQIIEQIYNELLYKNIQSYSIPSNILVCYKYLLINYITSIKKEVIDKMISSKIKETILKGQPNSTVFSNKKYFLEPNGPSDPIILNPNIFNKTNNKNNTKNLDEFINYLNTTIRMKDLTYLIAHKNNLSKAYSNIDIFNYDEILTDSIKPQKQTEDIPQKQILTKQQKQTEDIPQKQILTKQQKQVQTKTRGRNENNIPNKIFSTNYITKNDQIHYIIYNSQLDRSIKYVNQPTDCDLFLKDKTIINSSNDFRDALNLIHEQNQTYYQSLQNIFILFIFNNNRYIQINENINNYSHCFDIIDKELKQFQVQIFELTRQNTYFNEQIEMYKVQARSYQDDITKNIKEYDEKISQLNLEYDEKISQLNLEYDEKISQLNLDHDNKISQLTKECTYKIAELTKVNDGTIAELTKNHESKLLELNQQIELINQKELNLQESLDSKNLQIQKLKNQITSLITENKQNLENLANIHIKQIEDIKSSYDTEISQLTEKNKKEYKQLFDDQDYREKLLKSNYDEKISKLNNDHERQLENQKKIFESLLEKKDNSYKLLSDENLRLKKIEQNYNIYYPLFRNIITSYKDQIEYYLNSTLTNHLDLENLKNDYKNEISKLKTYLLQNNNNENIKTQLIELQKIKEYYTDKEDIIMSFGINEEKDKELLMSINNLKNNININTKYDINKLLETHFKIIYFQITLFTNFSLLHNLILITNKFKELLTETKIKINQIDTFKYLDINSDNKNYITYVNLLSYYKNLYYNYDKIFNTDSIINITLINKQPEFNSLLSLFKYYIDFYSKATIINKDSIQNINNTLKTIEDTYLKETKKLIDREKILEQEFLSNQIEFKALYKEIANYINNKILIDSNIRKLYINTLVSRKSNNELIQTFINYIKENDKPPQYSIDDSTPLNYVLELIQFLLNLNSNIISLLYKKNNELLNNNEDLIEKNEVLKAQIDTLKSSLSDCDDFKQKNTKLDEENKKLEQELDKKEELHRQELQKYKVAIADLEEQIVLLKKYQKEEIQNQLKTLIDEYETKKQEYEVELNKLKTSQWTVTSALEARDTAEKNLDQLQRQLNEVTKTLQEKLLLIKSNEVRIKEFEDNIKILQEYLKLDSKINIKNLVDKTIEKLMSYEEQGQYLSTLFINNKSLQDQLNALQQDMSLKVNTLKKEKQELIQTLKILKESMIGKDQKIKEIEELQIKLLTDKNTLESKLLEKDKEITNLKQIQVNQSQRIQQLLSKLDNDNKLSDNEKVRLNNEIQRLTQVNQLLESDNIKLQQQIINLTEQLEKEIKDLIIKSDDANITNETNIAKLQDIIKNKSAIIIQLNYKNGRLNQQIEKLQKENKEIKEELESNKRLLLDSQNNNEQLNKKNQKLKQELELNKTQLSQISNTIETQKKKILEFITNNSVSDTVISELKKQIQILTSANMQLLETNKMQDLELESQKSEFLIKLDTIKKELNDKILELETVKKTTKKNLNSENFEKITKLLDDIKKLENIQESLKKEIEKEKNQKSKELFELEKKYKIEISKLIKDKKSLEQNNLLNEELKTKYLTTITNLTKQLTEIQTENGTLKLTIETLKLNTESLIKEKNKLIAINKDLNSNIEQLKDNITKSQNVLNNQQLQSESKLRNYKDYIIKLQQKYKLQLNTLNKAKEDANRKLLKTELQLTECNQLKENIQMKLEEIIQNHKNDKFKDINEIKNLTQLLNALQSENEKLNTVIKDNLQKYNYRYTELKSQIDILNKQINDLYNDNQTLKDGFELQVDELRDKYQKDLESKLLALKLDYKKKQDELNKFIQNLDKFITRTNNVSEFQSIKLKLTELNDKYNNDINNLKLLNTKLEFEKLNLSKKISQLENAINLLKSFKIKDKEIKDQLEKELKEEINRLNDFINKKEIELNQLKSNSKSNEQNLLKSVGLMTQKENELRQCKIEIKKLEKLLQIKNNELQNLLSKIEEFKLKVTTLESKIINIQVQTDIDNQTKQLEINRLNKEISDLQKDNITLNDGIQLQLEKLDKKNKQELERYQKQLTDYKQKLDNCKHDLNSCQLSLTTCKTDLKTCKNTSDQLITKIQSELDISNSKLSQLELDKQNLESQLTTLKNILSKSNNSTTSELIKLKELNQQLQNENTKLKNSKSVINTIPMPNDDVQVIYKYINNPAKDTTNIVNTIPNTAFDKFIANNELIY